MSEQPNDGDDERDSSMVRVPNDVKADLQEYKDEHGYRSYGAAINGLLKETRIQQNEIDNLRTAIGKIPDAD